MKNMEGDRFLNESDQNEPKNTPRPHRHSLAAIATVVALSLVTLSARTGNVSNLNPNQESSSPIESISFHQSGFGGIQNQAHPTGARARRFLAQKEVIIPKSAVPHAIPSLGKPNIENLHGHYVHDEHNSPFSSFLYKRPKEELKLEQEEYEAKMNQVREEWGAWNFKDESNVVRPAANFDKNPYKDMDNDKFPANSWQTDETYVKDFIKEANNLVERMIEGIYAEYGHPTKKADGTMLTADEIEKRNELFKIHIVDEKPTGTGFSYINQAGMDALAQKLLHGMMTNDEFYFVLGGHSAAAGHGNNFLQQKTMQFNHIMEPIFHKLGMRLISRNLAMGGLGTQHYSFGQAELFGEKDFLMWDSMMTEREPGDLDLYNKQAMINGERVPIIFTHSINDLSKETNGLIWHGDVLTGADFCPLTTGLAQAETLPLATRFQRCELTVSELCADKNNPNKYDAYCWVPRSDFEPKTPQSEKFSSQVGWHPGNRYHQYESRKAAMTILHGFKAALQTWEEGMKEKGFPLKESYWHVGETYKLVQDTLKSYISGDGKNNTVCEKRMEPLGLSKACRIPLHGMAEFTPINLGEANSIHAHMKEAPNGWVPKPLEESYSGFDLLPLSWKIPANEVDVHAIAIATTYKNPQIDHKWYDEGDDNGDDEVDAEDSRRLKSGDTNYNTAVEDKLDSYKKNKRSLRKLSEDEVVPGLGWGIFSTTESEVTGYCDGSSVSFNCHRASTQNCLLSGHNDGRNTITGDGLSGWLVVQIPKLKEGLIFIRQESWHPRNDWYLTKDWTEVNNGNRALKAKVIPWPDDIFMDIAINGNIVDTWDKDKIEKMNFAIAYNEAIVKIFDNDSFVQSDEGESVEFAIRMRSESNPKMAGLSISHIYYA